MTSKKETPLMKQYYSIKARYPGALLLFRVGDFYETFGEDAINASKILDITLTKRANGSASEVALAGFPHHSLDTYLPKLVRAGERVAICDQLEDPKQVKGIVKRGVTELVTPGLVYDDNVLEGRANNYLASIHYGKQAMGAAFLDISTGEFVCAQGSTDYIEKLLQGFRPSEIIYSKPERDRFEHDFGDAYHEYHLEDWIYQEDFSKETLCKHFGTQNLKGFGVDDMYAAITAAGAIVHYLHDTEHKEVGHITSIARIEEDNHMWLDKFTIRNLELVYPQHNDGIALIDVIDSTLTPMGSRLLKRWVVLPLKDKAAIDQRLSIVESLHKQQDSLEEIQEQLSTVGDLERLISKVAARRVNPRELRNLFNSLLKIDPIKKCLVGTKEKSLKTIADQLEVCEGLASRIESDIKEEAPLVINQGNIFNEGINEELDELRAISHSGKDFLVQIQQREIERTGIPKIKIAYNKVFGYYLEVSNAHKDKVPEEWIRKQTLVNAERFITPELKEYEEKILSAEDKIKIIEFEMYNELVEFAVQYVNKVQLNAQLIGQIDCLGSFARTAIDHDYIKPSLEDKLVLDIKDGRHPVIERQLPPGESYIPNDVRLDSEDTQIMIITGPNMAGKSALLRQVALITLMAQIGSFVPASAATIGITDKIFTRVGASDNLSQGESTFMVEMIETASILNNLSERSLVLMDEIGRGTSTYDGISIAWSIVEFLHQSKSKPKTLFATHYHELNQLADDFPRVRNYNVSVKEVGDKIIFLRKLKEGGSEHSFGIHVAQLAGMPQKVVLRANEVLGTLEKDKISEDNKKKLEELPKSNFQMSMFEASNPHFEEMMEILDKIDINTISPVEALLQLNNIKRIASQTGKKTA